MNRPTGDATRWAVVDDGAGRSRSGGRLSGALADALGAAWLDGGDLRAAFAGDTFRAAVYAPARGGPGPRRTVQAVLDALAGGRLERVVVISSTEIYEPHHHNDLYFREEGWPRRPRPNPIAARWRDFEEAAEATFAALPGRLVVLRAAPVPLPGGDDPWSRLLRPGRLAATLPGHDPTLQFLALEDLAEAVRRVLVVEPAATAVYDAGVYNVVPAGAIPLRRALRQAAARRLPLPRRLQRAWRRVAGSAESAARLDYLRWGWTASGGRAAADLGFSARRTSVEAVAAAAGTSLPRPTPAFDDFGYDPDYVAAFGRTLGRFLHDTYWRVEVRGLEHVPRQGRAVLAGVHRGFMPLDGVMALHLLVRELGRPPRFLLHPTLLKFPFLFDLMTRLGGVPACGENADRILAADGLLAIYPEGIRGAFTPYRRAYRLGRFGRDEYVRMALRNRAPIVPFVTVGSAEIFPILGRLDWSWWRRYSEWPYLPITPTFPWLPVPLPSKWHTRYLEPLHVEEIHGPHAADEAEVVAAISRQVRRRMAAAIAEMLARRRSIWFGSVFEEESGPPRRSRYR